MTTTWLITGGAGFIGSNLVIATLRELGVAVVTLDKLTYAGNLANLREVADHPHHRFVRGDVCDRALLREVFAEARPAAVLHLAAESHVDRSIDSPGDFVHTNLVGTFALLEAARAYHASLDAEARQAFRFVHVSTDEVYGALGPEGKFTETTPYAPSSPYAASKAGADHLARAYHVTYGLPVIVTNCSNNLGPRQFPEKLIPLMIFRALAGKSLPIYGDGQHVRDWLYVDDHVAALHLVARRGIPGQTYNIGGAGERTNLQVVHELCSALDELAPRPDGQSYAEQIAFVPDRPGHDRRYAIDASKIQRELGWTARASFASAIRHTVRWYLEQRAWREEVAGAGYEQERLGLAETAPDSPARPEAKQ